MKKFASYLLFLVLIKIILCNRNFSRRIAYGFDPPNPVVVAYPFITQALLVVYKHPQIVSQCTCTIIHPRFIYTAGKINFS